MAQPHAFRRPHRVDQSLLRRIAAIQCQLSNLDRRIRHLNQARLDAGPHRCAGRSAQAEGLGNLAEADRKAWVPIQVFLLLELIVVLCEDSPELAQLRLHLRPFHLADFAVLPVLVG